MVRFVMVALVACSSSPRPPAGDDGWKVQLLPDAAVDAGPEATDTSRAHGDERLQVKRDPSPTEKVRCLRLIGCGCDYGCQMGFWEDGVWKVNYLDAGTVAVIQQECVGTNCVDIWYRDVCAKSCDRKPTAPKCRMTPDNVYRCDPEQALDRSVP